MSFINEYVVEVAQYPRKTSEDRKSEFFTVKDYFFYDSNTKEYGYRDTIIPISRILNKDEIPDTETMKTIINNKDFVIVRSINYQTEEQSWYFDSSKIGEK